MIFVFERTESYPSWLIDDAKFHISAHGQISCQDCHESIVDENLHPNPEDVNKEPADFFSIDQCLACHDEILDDLDNGVHVRHWSILKKLDSSLFTFAGFG